MFLIYDTPAAGRGLSFRREDGIIDIVDRQEGGARTIDRSGSSVVRRWAFVWGPLLAYAVLSLLLTWPLVTQFATHVPGDGIDDPSLAWNLWWAKHALVNQPQNPFLVDWQFWPIGINLAFYTLTLLNGALSIPLQVVFGVIPAYNLLLLSSFVLSGFGAYLLALDFLGGRDRGSGRTGVGITGSPHHPVTSSPGHPIVLSAFVGGALYAFASTKLFYAALGQGNIASSQWIPFAALYILRTVRPQGRWRDAALAALFIVLQAYAELTFASFLVIFAALAAAWGVWQAIERRSSAVSDQSSVVSSQFSARGVGSTGGGRRSVVGGRWSFIVRLALVGVLFTAGIAPILANMLPDLQAEGDFFTSGGGFADIFSADLAGYTLPTQLHPLLGGIIRGVANDSAPRPDGSQFPINKGQQIYLGYVALVLAAVGWWRGRHQAAIWFWGISAIFFLVLTLGPSLRVAGHDLHVPLPFDLIAQLPFFKGNRYPSRYAVMLLMSVSVLLAAGVRQVLAPGITAETQRARRIPKLIPRWNLHPTPVADRLRARISCWLWFRAVVHAERGATAPAGENVTQAAGLSSHGQAQSGGSRYGRSLRAGAEGLFGIILALLLFEHLSAPLPLSDLRVPTIYDRVVAAPGDFALLELPPGWRNGARVAGKQDIVIMQELWNQTAHGKRVLGGNTSRNPEFKFQFFSEDPTLARLIATTNAADVPQDSALAASLAANPITPVEAARARAWAATWNIRYVMVHRDKLPTATEAALRQLLPVSLVAQAGDLALYALTAGLTPPVRFPVATDAGRMVLAEGWSPPGLGEAVFAQRSEVRLLLPLGAGARQLRFDMWAEAPDQQVTLVVDGRTVAAQPLSKQRSWLAFDLPQMAAHAPLSDVRLRFTRLAPIAQVAAAGAAADPGGTAASGPALTPVPVVVRSAGQETGDFAHIYINGVDLSPDRRGYNLVALDAADGHLLQAAAFDTHADPAAARQLADWVKALPPGALVAGAVRDEASMNLGAEAVEALRSLGITTDLRGHFRWGHAFIGQVGAQPGAGLEQVNGIRVAQVAAGMPATAPQVAAALSAVEIVK